MISKDMGLLFPDNLLPKSPSQESTFLGISVDQAPLKRNALAMLIPRLAAIGFATAPVKAQKDSFAVRIVWIYPKARAELPYRRYEPVGLVRIPVRMDVAADRWEFAFASYGRYVAIFRQFIRDEEVRNPKMMFSTEGLAEIEIAIEGRQRGGHDRTLRQKRRVRIIAELPELWNDPDRIVCLLRDCGLYSEKMAMHSQIESVRDQIRKLRAARDCGK
jgi:hypothetical protein